MYHHTQLISVFFVETGFHHVGQASLELLLFFLFLFFLNGLEVSVGWENHKESGVQRNVLSRGEELGC